MTELGSNLYQSEDGILYKLVPATLEDVQEYFLKLRKAERAAQVEKPADRDSVAYLSKSIGAINRLHSGRENDIIGGRD